MGFSASTGGHVQGLETSAAGMDWPVARVSLRSLSSEAVECCRGLLRTRPLAQLATATGSSLGRSAGSPQMAT